MSDKEDVGIVFLSGNDWINHKYRCCIQVKQYVSSIIRESFKIGGKINMYTHSLVILTADYVSQTKWQEWSKLFNDIPQNNILTRTINAKIFLKPTISPQKAFMQNRL